MLNKKQIEQNYNFILTFSYYLMYNTTCKKGKRCINPPDMLKVAIGKKPKKILIFLLWFKDRMHFAFFLYYMWRCFV